MKIRDLKRILHVDPFMEVTIYSHIDDNLDKSYKYYNDFEKDTFYDNCNLREQYDGYIEIYHDYILIWIQ